MIQGYSLCSVLRLEMMSILWIIENETLQKKSVVKVIFKIFWLRYGDASIYLINLLTSRTANRPFNAKLTTYCVWPEGT